MRITYTSFNLCQKNSDTLIKNKLNKPVPTKLDQNYCTIANRFHYLSLFMYTITYVEFYMNVYE